jgi:hypothetical protein
MRITAVLARSLREEFVDLPRLEHDMLTLHDVLVTDEPAVEYPTVLQGQHDVEITARDQLVVTHDADVTLLPASSEIVSQPIAVPGQVVAQLTPNAELVRGGSMSERSAVRRAPRRAVRRDDLGEPIEPTPYRPVLDSGLDPLSISSTCSCCVPIKVLEPGVNLWLKRSGFLRAQDFLALVVDAIVKRREVLDENLSACSAPPLANPEHHCAECTEASARERRPEGDRRRLPRAHRRRPAVLRARRRHRRDDHASQPPTVDTKQRGPVSSLVV